ncbi:MAG TPA: class I SAM-dependent methyltransferase [bacterium]|nr:class I SAM-dependent methyltransferase [bacterium]HPJ71424.1 class I SAM-dependent methyltransferase [bacterium]HPQ65221.1 class I SAM-dependent methyltransferase [bacterium]
MSASPSAPAGPFQRFFREYDRWFDSARGRAIFDLEVAALHRVMGAREGRWLEVGVGTGRFASALSVADGLDPAASMLVRAAARGIRAVRGGGEELPFAAGAFDGVLMVVTICFLDDPARSLRECRRVVKKEGKLVLGFVPAAGPWGRLYESKARAGHRFYSSARLYGAAAVRGLAAAAGFVPAESVSCLFDPPGGKVTDRSLRPGMDDGAGFVAAAFAPGG